MPRGSNTPEPAPVPANVESMALMLPPDVRADLLRAQAESIQTVQKLPQIKVLPAGVALFEMPDGEALATFQGVVLSNHPRNVLWDRKFGDAPPPEAGESAKLPACSSLDGKVGTPREGFQHAALRGTTATGTEVIECRTCPYNAWGSGAMLITTNNPKGKAVTNQRSVYVLLEGMLTPAELVLPPTSLAAFDEYLTSLVNRSIPVQAVVTTFRQVKKQRAGSDVKWGQVTFEMASPLGQEAFNNVMTKREQFYATMNPGLVPQGGLSAPMMEDSELDGGEIGEDGDLPF